MRHLTALSALFLPLVALAQTPPPSSIGRVEKGLSPPTLIEGDATWTIAERMTHYKVPGLSVAVIENFKIAWAKGYGIKDKSTNEPVNEHTLFQAGSISKPVAATVAMKKVEQGKLSLDDNVNAQLKSWKLPENEFTAKHKVTLANLLSHTGGTTVHGFPGYEAGAKLPTLPQVLDGAAPANTPAVRVDLESGTRFRYSGGGTTIAQLMLQDLEGKPFDVIAKKTLLDVLVMRDSTYSQPLPKSLQGQAASGHERDGSAVAGKYHTYPEMAAAGLWTTPTDLAKFAIETQLSALGRSNRILEKATVERMLTRFLPDGPTGLGFFIEQHGPASYFGHNGADEGFTAMLLVHREKGYGAALMVNSQNAEVMREVLNSIAREYRWEGWDTVIKRVAVKPDVLDTYLGRYELGADDVITLTREGDRLFGQKIFGGKTELVLTGDAAFVRREVASRYAFERAADGRIDAISIQTPENTSRARRLAEGEMVPLEMLVAGRTTEAIEAYRKARRERPNDDLVTETHLNRVGLALRDRNKTAEGLAVLELNAELYPQAWNTYDSLGATYLQSGNREAAASNYRRSLELNPRNKDAIEALKKLEPAGATAEPAH